MKAEIVTFPQRHKQEFPYRCSACGADRGCDCNAPAIEKANEVLARAERKRIADRERIQEKRNVARQAFENEEEIFDARNPKDIPRNVRRVVPEDDADNPPPDVMAPIDPAAHKLQRKIFEFTAAYNSAVKHWLKRADIDQHTKEVLSRSIHQCANDLSILAQGVLDDD